MSKTIQTATTAPLTCVSIRLSPKITTSFSSYESDNDEILLFENPKFENPDEEAVFVVLKKDNEKGLEGAQVFAVTRYEDLDWSKWLLVDSVLDWVEEEEVGGELRI